MKVGVLIEFTSDTDIDAKFAELKEMGVDSCQLVCWDRPTLQDDAMAEAINKGLEKYGIHATAFWCGWEGRRVWDFYEGQLTLGLIPSDYRVERLKMLMEGSDFAKKINGLSVTLMRSVRKVQARDIESRPAHFRKYLLRAAGRADGTDDLRFSHMKFPL